MKSTIVLLLALLGAIGTAPVAMAQNPSTFTASGALVTRRIYHTATLLADGRVLIAGGQNYGQNYASPAVLASAELYDPATGTFTATGSMTAPRQGHTATLLPNGKVMIAGGNGGNGSVASAELYDPATGTFAATGNMTGGRLFHVATLINSGKVLIAGGRQQGTDAPEVSAELYDPATGTFTATGNMKEPSCDTATLLPNGKVLVTRSVGYDPATDSDTFSTHAELYDPSTGTFAFTGDTVTFHSGPTATLLVNGKVLIAGGDVGDGDGPSVGAELYDPATGTFTATGDLIVPREAHAASLLPDGAVLFTGGHFVYDAVISAEFYDPARQVFSFTSGMPVIRELHTSTLLNDGRVLITGGDDVILSPNILVSTAALYTPPTLVLAPVLFSLSGDGQGAIWDAGTGQIASSLTPAVAGEVLSMYTSLGNGSAIQPQVAIGGRLGEVVFFGSAPGYPGYSQVNVRVPSGVAPGAAVPVRLTYLGRTSNEVTIGLQ